LELPQPKLNEAYQKNPQQLFSESDDDRRQRLLRLFYMNVTRTEILLNADSKGRNAEEILERLKASLPDDPDLINRFEDLRLSWRFSQLPQASRDAAIELSQEYRERKLPEKARHTLEVWLEARLKNWRQEGARGLVRAAEEYLSLLEDDQTAHKLLLQAWKLAPGEEDTKSALQRLGYRLHGDRWITEKEFEKIAPDRVEEAIKNGEVLLEMTARDVRRALGAPSEIHTSVSAGEVLQSWIYGEPGTLRSVVHLARSSQYPADQAQVIAIGELKAKKLERGETVPETSEENDEE
jgi:tetratricopeptide (TPR) repeat protein